MDNTPAERKEYCSSPILELQDLSVTYLSSPEPVRAVRGASFQVDPGDTVSLVGETGSGKSSIALAVLGLLENQRQSGLILFKGRNTETLTPRDWKKIRSREIGMVFQDSRSALNPVLTILDQMIETLRAHQDFSKSDARSKAVELLKEVGIPEEQGRAYPFELSGGTCQRAGIALGICNEPQLLIADEPTSSIDTSIQAQILELLQTMKERHRLALLLISHDLPLVGQISDRICVMYHGRVVESGLKREVVREPAHPYTRALMQCQPSLLHHHEARRLSAIPGILPKSGEELPGCAFAPRCPLAEPRCVESIPALTRLSGTRSVECIKADTGYGMQDTYFGAGCSE